jgi:predicted permease
MRGDGRRPGRIDPDVERIESEVEEEIRLHLEACVAELVGEGTDPDRARALALARFGDMERTRAVCVEADRRWMMRTRRRSRIDAVASDLRISARALAARPWFTVSAVATLVLGIGAGTAIFSAADHVLFRPLPYADADRVVTLWRSDPKTGETRIPAAMGDFLQWERLARSFSAVGLAEPTGVDLVAEGVTESVSAWGVTPAFFRALGVAPWVGRDFQPGDADRTEGRVVIVSDGFWKRRLAGDPDAVGSTIEMNGAPTTIIGVLPPVDVWPSTKEVWVPKVLYPNEENTFGRGYMFVAGRLAPGVTLATARAEMASLGVAIGAEFRDSSLLDIEVVALREQILAAVRPAILVLLGAVGLLLLVACANVAGLLLARGAQRSGELAVRAALGAERSRLFGQLLAESAAIAILGGVGGVALAWAGLGVLTRLLPPDLPRASSITIDPRILAFALLATVGTALLCGLLPSLRFSRVDALDALRGERSATGGRGRSGLRRGLVLLEVAVATVLLVGGGLLTRSFVQLVGTDLGFDAEGVASVQVFLWDRNPRAGERLTRADAMLERIRSTTGVRSAGIVTALPFHPSRIDAVGQVVAEGRQAETPPQMYTTIADSGYFATVGVPVVAGRGFTSADDAGGPPVALLNETAARQLLPDVDPVGRFVTFGAMERAARRQVVGVVGDVRPEAFDSRPQPELFVPFAQSPNGSVTFVARGPDPGTLVAELREAVWGIDPGQSIYHAATMETMLRATLADRRFALVLVGAFAALSLVLAAVGLFGLISFTVTQRTRELGIRVALGARRGQIAGLVLRDGVLLGAGGVGVGLLAALLSSRALVGLLYGVAATDPLTYGVLATLMLAVVAVASWLPARRAARRDPVEALRVE